MRRAVAGKARVHELAKELGVTSKEVLNKLAEQGEYVKSASSTVEAPVARRLRDAFPKGGASKKSEANGRPSGGAKPAPPAREPSGGDGAASETVSPKPGPKPGPKPEEPEAERPKPGPKPGPKP